MKNITDQKMFIIDYANCQVIEYYSLSALNILQFTHHLLEVKVILIIAHFMKEAIHF